MTSLDRLESSELLVVVLDTNASAWRANAIERARQRASTGSDSNVCECAPLLLEEAVAQLALFCNAHLMATGGAVVGADAGFGTDTNSGVNRVVVIAAQADGAHLLLPPAPHLRPHVVRGLAAAEAAEAAAPAAKVDGGGSDVKAGGVKAHDAGEDVGAASSLAHASVEQVLSHATRALLAHSGKAGAEGGEGGSKIRAKGSGASGAPAQGAGKTSTIAAALSQALCIAQRHKLGAGADADAAAAAGVGGAAAGAGAGAGPGPSASTGVGATAASAAACKRAALRAARILVLKLAHDDPAQYVPVMNAIFAAAQLGVPIDTLELAAAAARGVGDAGATALAPLVKATPPVPSVQMMQASDQTYGVYCRYADAVEAARRGARTAAGAAGAMDGRGGGDGKGVLLQQLLSCFYTSAAAGGGERHGGMRGSGSTRRGLLRVPPPAAVDFRVTCFDTGSVREVAWVCPTCLAVYERADQSPCLVCGDCGGGAEQGKGKARKRARE
eukprot:g3208.t1